MEDDRGNDLWIGIIIAVGVMIGGSGAGMSSVEGEKTVDTIR